MSVANEILRLQTAKADIKTAIENKGVTVGDGTIDTYAEKINEISGGDGGSYEQGYNDGYEKGKAEGIQPQDFEITSSVSNANQLKNILFANIPINHFATAYLIKPKNQSEYIYNQIAKISLGNGDVAVRYRNTPTYIGVGAEYDASVTIGDIYRVFDLGEV